MLEVKNLQKYFGGIKAVDGCSFKVFSNTITALIGPNGAGKTTVFNLICGLSKPDQGQILLAGNNLVGLPAYKRAHLGIARTFQMVRMFQNLTIKDNLLLALEKADQKFWSSFFNSGGEDRDEIKKVLDLVGLDKKENVLSADLSYGQQKLLTLACALLKPHKLLMLDEPVAGVNPVLRDKLKDILLELKKDGETIFLIEHDMDFVMAIADRIIVLDMGKVLVDGTPEEIKRNKKVLEAYLGEQI